MSYNINDPVDSALHSLKTTASWFVIALANTVVWLLVSLIKVPVIHGFCLIAGGISAVATLAFLIIIAIEVCEYASAKHDAKHGKTHPMFDDE